MTPRNCPDCGLPNEPEATRCSHCGSSNLAPEEGAAGLTELFHSRSPSADETVAGLGTPGSSTPDPPTEEHPSGIRQADAAAAPPPVPPIGTPDRDTLRERLEELTAGRFEVGECLGRGGMAAVYQATDLNLMRTVAIKVLLHALSHDPGMMERFRREGQTIASLDHPHIVRVHQVEHHDDLSFYALQYVSGGSLAGVLKAGEPLPLDVILAWFAQLADALDYGHELGVIHRDLKPANILLDRHGNAVLTDFGIAQVDAQPRQTRTGMVVGTPTYMSPEQWEGASISAASDQYSLGIVLYEMLCGRPPFDGNTISLLRSHAEDPPPNLLEARTDCPPELAASVARMLEKKPANRWPEIRQAAAAAGASKPSDDDPVFAAVDQLTRAIRIEKDIETPPSRVRTLVRDHPRATAGMSLALLLPFAFWGLPKVPWPEFGTEPAEVVAASEGQPGPTGTVPPVVDSGEVVAPPPVTPRDPSQDPSQDPSEDPSEDPADPQPSRLAGLPAPISLEVGQRAPLSGYLVDQLGRRMSNGLTWQTEDQTLASVESTTGTASLMGLDQGSTRVRATVAGLQSPWIDVTISAPSATRVAVDASTLQLNVGEAQVIGATVYGSDDRQLTAPVAWSSDQPATAAVDAAGRITGVAAGSAQLTVRSGGASANVAVVVVEPAPNTSVTDLSSALVVGGDANELWTLITLRGSGRSGDIWCVVATLERDDGQSQSTSTDFGLAAGASQDIRVATPYDAVGLSTARGFGRATVTSRAQIWGTSCAGRTNEQPLDGTQSSPICLVKRAATSWQRTDCDEP